MPLGIRYSEFLEWPEDDQAYAIAWRRRENRKCGNCGTFSEDWLDEEGKHLDDPPYEVTAIRCLGCEALAEERTMADEELDSPSKPRKYIFGFRRRRKGE